MILDAMPRVRLLDAPTPLERLGRIEAMTGHGGLWVKRDDAMPLGLGGNKVRSLEFWLGQALARDSDVLLVAGRAVSNQCRLTAAAAARLGLDCIVLYNDAPPAERTGNLLLTGIFGAEVRFLGPVDEDARRREAEGLCDALRAAGRRPYLVGDPVVGALGYIAGALELHGQARIAGADLRHLVLPGSMGVTEAGFLHGCALLGWPVAVHLVTVEYEVPELERRVEAILRGIAALNGAAPGSGPGTGPGDLARYHGAYLGEGYDVPTAAALDAVRTFGAREALALETTYTAKTFAGMLDLIARGALPKDEPACIIHTGGVPALFGQAGLLARG